MHVWLPLESNPELLSNYMVKLGVSPLWSVVDIYGIDDEILDMVPKPVKSLIFLFPCSKAHEEFRAKESEELHNKGVEHPKSLFYTRQFVRNACGTIAVIHAILNNSDIEIEQDSVLQKYFDSAKDLSPEERGDLLHKNVELKAIHEENAQQGQTATPNINDEVFHHFIAFVHVDGILYELDGSRHFPVAHGKTTPETLLKDSVEVCKKFIELNPSEVRFTLLGLVPTQ
ncbi:ubiquitin carboxyl-terminal hydrolase-like [Anopheles marshallii]|uniref:ubiquitin carboxyl-terminal hydrolase-like n=1 Tax=Anopheles marshallii TaxID=1521116 RepID=UPI00237A9561|nr:ubiquitin carboxyl-terminal hydrolase-like [Anopheles marshallii]